MDTPGATRLSLRDFLDVVFKRKIQILLFFGATLCTVAIGTLMAESTYKALSQILMKVGTKNIYFPTVRDVT